MWLSVLLWIYCQCFGFSFQKNLILIISRFQLIRKFRRYIQQVDFLGVSGRVHFNKGDRLSDIIIKQKFTSHSAIIGHFIHSHKPNATYSGGLQWNPNKITWASGTIPSDVLPGELLHFNYFLFQSYRSKLSPCKSIVMLIYPPRICYLLAGAVLIWLRSTEIIAFSTSNSQQPCHGLCIFSNFFLALSRLLFSGSAKRANTAWGLSRTLSAFFTTFFIAFLHRPRPLSGVKIFRVSSFPCRKETTLKN